MCGRYVYKDGEEIDDYVRRTLGLPDWVKSGSRYNIAPSQDCPIIIMDDEGDVLPIPCTMRWGIRPERDGQLLEKFFLVNFRAETATTNKLLGRAVQKRRCLIPADGFYEWLRLDEKTKYPFYIRRKGAKPFVMAGVYEKATTLQPATFSIVTTAPNTLMQRIHDRMPAILDPERAKRWLQPGPVTQEDVAQLTASYPAEDMEATPISSLVNSPKNDTPEILTPVAPPPPAPPKETQGTLF